MHVDFTLDEAKTSVLSTLERLTYEEHLWPEAHGADYAASVNSFTDTFALDEWVLGTKPLDDRICRWPLCFNPPRPPATTNEGTTKGGNRPRYCDRHDEGKPDTVPQRSRRRRQALRDRRDARTASDGAGADTNMAGDGSQPVSHARTTMASIVAVIERALHEVTESFRTLEELAQRTTNEEMVASEIEAARIAARQDVEQEKGLRVAAEQQELEARTAVTRMNADVEEIQAALAALEESSARDRAERDAAVTRADEAGHERDEAIAAAQREFERELRERGNEMARQVAAATEARDKALADAEARERVASAQVAAAQQRAADLQEERDEAKALNARLAEENIALRDVALGREREFDAEIRTLRETHQNSHDALQAGMDKLRTRIETMLAGHNHQLEQQRIRHEETLAARLGEAAETADRVHRAEIARLVADKEVLQIRLDAAQQ